MSELALTVADAESPDQVASFGWTFWPEHVLEAIDLLLVHVGAYDKLSRPPVYAQPKAQGHILEARPMRAAIPKKAIDAAVAVLYLQRSRAPGDGRLYWHLPVYETCSWKSRLTLCGIDYDTIQIVDRRRWAFCWKQLMEGDVLKPTFSQVKQMELINSREPTPEVSPRVNEFKVLKRSAKTRVKKEKSLQRKVVAQEQDDYGFTQPPKNGSIRPLEY